MNDVTPAGRAAARPSEPATPPLGEGARRAIRDAFALLAIRGYSTEELRRRLARRHDEPDVRAAIEWLAASPFLDDRQWAAGYVSGRRGRERSSALLRRDLRAKGVSEDDAAFALEAHDDAASALAAARRRLPALRSLPPEVRVRRLRDYLLRRGFGAAVVQSTLRRVLDERGGDERGFEEVP